VESEAKLTGRERRKVEECGGKLGTTGWGFAEEEDSETLWDSHLVFLAVRAQI
jgi:hypothetical protein